MSGLRADRMITQFRPGRVQRPRFVGSRRTRALGGLRARGLSRALRDSATWELSVAGRDRPERHVSSVRPVGNAHYANEVPPPTAPVYEYRRRPNERLFEVPISYVRAVVGPPEQRCWVERQQVAEPPQGAPNVPGRSSARSSAAFSDTRSAAGAARMWRRRVVLSPAPRSVPMSDEARARRTGGCPALLGGSRLGATRVLGRDLFFRGGSIACR